MEKELREKDTFESRGHHIYSAGITPAESEAAALATQVISKHTFREWAGNKTCGG